MGIFISVDKTIECVAIALFFSLAMLLSSAKLLGILQSCLYSNKKLIEWTRKKNNLTVGRHLLLAICCFLTSGVLSLAFSFLGEWAAVISLAGFVIFYVLYIYADSRLSLRSPATLTPRFGRLMASVWLVCAIVSYLFVTLLNFADYCYGNALFTAMRYVPLAVLPLLLIPLVCLSNSLIKIYEVPRNASYIKKAKAKLASAPDLKIIGITGSYGKTSTKKILAQLLSPKYKVLSTPRSHNTPLGISMTINSNDLEKFDIFIAEMGARHVGDIAQLCEICPPDYSLITGICPQHLESFHTMENIISGKGEILEATKECAFIAEDCFSLFENYDCAKVKCDCVSDVECDCDGTTFTLSLGGNKYKVRTKLLGEHSAHNIGLCALCAYEMGVGAEDICSAIGNLDYIEHRLQLIKSGGINIIDDGYNANVKGAEAAINVLKTFGGAKIIVTPGLVELGVLDIDENAALGAKLVGLDHIILVGDTLVGYVKQGYLDAGGDPLKVTVVKTLFDAEGELAKIVGKGDTVLFLNDLPDIYN